MKIFLEIIFILFMIFCIARLVPYANEKIDYVNPEIFKKVKIKKFSWLFTGFNGKDTIYSDKKKYGVILPMFIMHILGYILSLISLILLVVLASIGINMDLITYIIFGTLLFHLVVYDIVLGVCSIISKKHDKNIK